MIVAEAMTDSFDPCGVITLTTDFGHKGPYVASMKGVVYQRFPTARIVDVSHENEVHWPPEAGFWLERCYRYFPSGTVHVAVVDPGVGTDRDIVALVHEGHVFLAPDNGLLGPLVSRAGARIVHRYDPQRAKTLGLPSVSATFHGRDIFAPLGADMASGHRAPEDLGPRVGPDELVPGWADEPRRVGGGRLQGTVITFDHFGNVITNVEGSALDELSRPFVRVGGHDIPVQRTYGDVEPGDYLALINSFGMLEIARAEGDAREGLGVERGAPVTIHAGT